MDMQFSADLDKYQINSYSSSPLYEHEQIPWSLIGTFIFTTGCLYSYYLTMKKQRYPSWYIFPMISFCGCYPSERPLWRAAFILAAVGQTMAQLTFHQTQLYKRFLCHAPNWLQQQSTWWLSAHIIATGMVGVFHLSVDQCLNSIAGIGPEADLNDMVCFTFQSQFAYDLICNNKSWMRIFQRVYIIYLQ